MNNIEIVYKNNLYVIQKRFWYIFTMTLIQFEHKYQLFEYIRINRLSFDNIKWINVHEPYEKYAENNTNVYSLKLCMTGLSINLCLDKADYTYVLDDSDNGYELTHKPYLEYDEPFRTTHCIPCWSYDKSEDILKGLDEYEEKKLNEYHIDNKTFDTEYEMDQWILNHPKCQILNIRYPYGYCHFYEIKYKYKLKDMK